MCAIRSKPYGWDLRKKAKISSKNTQKNIFGLFIFPQKLSRRLKRLFTVILQHITAPCVQIDQNRMAGIQGRKPKLVQKTQKNYFGFFIFPQKLCRRLKRLFTAILHHITAPCVQIDQNRMAGILERKPTLVQKAQNKTFLDFLSLIKNCAGD